VATREVHDLIASLREQGVTIFLTTHRLEEAERLCDRVAILNTTLRLIGRPDELRKQLFRRSVDVRLRAPVDDPKAVFGTLPEIEGWEQTPSGYSLTVSDPDLAAPALARALVGADADIVSIAEVRHSLEDVYLELIDDDEEACGGDQGRHDRDRSRPGRGRDASPPAATRPRARRATARLSSTRRIALSATSRCRPTARSDQPCSDRRTASSARASVS
jgi:hypothetical protein